MQRDITVENVDLDLLNEQRIELHELLMENPHTWMPDESSGKNTDPTLWGLLEMLDYICEKYEVVAKTCNCECGCEVPLSAGQCVDCGDGTHQNNNA